METNFFNREVLGKVGLKRSTYDTHIVHIPLCYLSEVVGEYIGIRGYSSHTACDVAREETAQHGTYSPQSHSQLKGQAHDLHGLICQFKEVWGGDHALVLIPVQREGCGNENVCTCT